MPDDPDYLQQWGLNVIGAPAAWDAVQAASGTLALTSVCVVDSGVDVNHPDLVGSLAGPTYNVLATSPDQSTDVTDNIGHGTHITGAWGLFFSA